EYPLRYEHGNTLTLKLSKSNKILFSKMLDMLSYKLECEIWAIVVCSPRCSLGEGLTIVEDDGDMKKLYAIAKKCGLVNLYIAHIPENLSEYYFKILTLDASNEEVKSKVKSHEKRKLDAFAMSPQELVEWAAQESNGPVNVGGPSTWCDLVHESVVEKGDSLPIMDKECFSNNVVLDDVVPANRKSMLLLLMKKGRNKVSVTRNSRRRNNSKTFRLRKGFGKRVSRGANTRRLGSSPSLNVHVVDEDSQVTKKGSLSAGSYNTEDKDLGSLSVGSSNTDDKDLEKVTRALCPRPFSTPASTSFWCASGRTA
nr:transposase, MuDR, MULE transposase domain protein [Tanacetum cinerariifolium]